MTQLSELFIKTKAQNRAALIGYVPAGFPTKAECIATIKAMVAGGVDAIEVGYPYSDPVMDGPIIQAAAELSLSNGTSAKDVFDTLEAAVSFGVPAVVMTYWNPIERFGVAKFAAEIAKRGGSGVITPDLTVEESATWKSACEQSDINRIYVVAPSTTEVRLPQVVSQCSGFVYAASLMGVTGTRTSVSGNAKSLVERIRTQTDTPVSVGLGVSTKEQASEVAKYADGVIVGSAFIKQLQESSSIQEGLAKVEALAKELSEGVRR
jgi:tryptophan synthase alpha chain